MKIKVSVQDELMINQNLKKVLMNSTAEIYIVDEVTIKDLDVTSTTGLFKKTTATTKERFITSANIIAYHQGGDFIGSLCDRDAEKFLNHFNLYALRKNWLNFKAMLKEFGFEIQKIVVPDDVSKAMGGVGALTSNSAPQTQNQTKNQ